MATFTAILQMIPLIAKFWDQVVWMVQTLQKTPEEEHQALMDSIKKEADNYAKPGSRPQW